MANPHHIISQGLHLAANPIHQIPNDINERVLGLQVAMDAGFQDVNGNINALFATLNANINNLRATINTHFDLLPLRLANAAAAGHTNVCYPQGVANNGNLPVTKNDIINMSGVMADNVALVLGIPMQNGLTAADRRRVVAEYLGITM
ncbi:hypothetical protein AB1N83_007332 [Pleurotus pulmonarius]